jgi:succinate dehydrogenase / fumarate reductase iron-sulfur subunit
MTTDACANSHTPILQEEVCAMIRAKIYRFDPDKDKKPYFSEYEVPVERKVTVHELLNIIHRDHDGSLAFRTFKCYKGMCTTCIVKVNGKNVKSCAHPLDTDAEITIEPVDSGTVVRDLVVDFKNM